MAAAGRIVYGRSRTGSRWTVELGEHLLVPAKSAKWLANAQVLAYPLNSTSTSATLRWLCANRPFNHVYTSHRWGNWATVYALRLVLQL
jgi:hypothetical protein